MASVTPLPLDHGFVTPSHGGLSRIGWLGLFTGLAVLLNSWPIPLFYGVHLLLGSVAAILALLLWRSWWAVAIGAIASLQTIALWGHPWAVVIFTAEMVWLTLAMRHCNGPASNDSNGRVVLFDALYWLVLGAPLVLLFYGQLMGMDTANVMVVSVKQSFNGVFNTGIAFTALVAIRLWQGSHNKGPGVSLRGVIMALTLVAVTVPTLLISLAGGHQLELAVQQGAFDGLETVNLALGRATAGDQSTQLLMQRLGEAVAYRRILPSGETLSSDPDLFRRLDSQFEDGGRGSVHNPDLAILIPRMHGAQLTRWVKGYWSYSRQVPAADGSSKGMALVQVVQPARTVVTRMQRQSTTLLTITFAVVLLGSLSSQWIGRRFEREFRRVLAPLEGDERQLQPLQLSAVADLNALAQLVNHRLHQVNRLAAKLRRTNETLRLSRSELRRLVKRDLITGCGNREALQLRLEEEWHRCRRSGETLSCLCLVLQAMPEIHRDHGHRAGDALLQGIVQAIRKRMRITDHLYRWSDDTLVLLASDCPPQAAHQLSGELSAAIAAVHLIPEDGGPLELRTNAGIGISTLDSDCTAPEELLERARHNALS